MAETPHSLGELASRYGVATEYQDWTGRHVDVPETTLVAVLAALGVPAATEDERSAALASHDRDYWTRSLPPTIVARSDSEASFWVHVTHGEPVGLWIRLEDGSVRAGLRQLENDTPPFDLGDRLVGEATFELPPDLPLGYHRLYLQAGSSESSAPLIVVPAKLELPLRLGGKRIWGLATQLYSVQSERSWGIGDLTDLTDLAVWSAANHGAGFILVNPMHAAAPVAPMEPSPYLPTSRRYVNPLYLRPEAIPEFAEVGRRSRIRRRRLELQKEARHADLIDRDAAWKAKRDVARKPSTASNGPQADSWHTRRTAHAKAAASTTSRSGARWPNGTDLTGIAGRRSSPALPAPRSPGSRPSTPRRSTSTGGCSGSSTISWRPRSRPPCGRAWRSASCTISPSASTRTAPTPGRCRMCSRSASPRAHRPTSSTSSVRTGRSRRGVPTNWSSQGYEPFRAMVNAILRHAGGVRVDHIIGLFRLWWIPKGALPTEGTYVRYDHEAMIGILALEAHRAEAVVVGEDLGTVEPWVRDYLARSGVCSARRSCGSSSIATGTADRWLPQRWREYCLSSVTTHDLPPTAGYLAGEHVRLRAELGLLTRPVEEELADDRSEQSAWVAELRRAGLLGEKPGVDDTVLGLYRYLGRTPSRLLGLSLADAVGEMRTQNQPGTTDEYPNWRVPLGGPDGRRLLLEDVFGDPRAASLCEALRAAVNTQV